MNDETYIECMKCGWRGGPDECVCSKDDEDKPVKETKFNRCPQCGGTDFEDSDESYT